MKRSYTLMRKSMKLIQPNRVSISPKQVTFSKLVAPKLATCTIENCIKPLNNKGKDTSSPAPTLQQISNIVNDTFEYNPNKLKQIFYKFIVNVDIDIDLLECSNLIRNSIQSAKINSQRLDELFLQITAQSNSMDLLCSNQMSMIQNLQVYQ
ncbi:Hypothetical_protein [Hexamita inflata]|uniref:Hypothetical_protein n=1 Tax=Hexamita inflata TaxID=28002 RepID=A0ABP1I107_9EUKA